MAARMRLDRTQLARRLRDAAAAKLRHASRLYLAQAREAVGDAAAAGLVWEYDAQSVTARVGVTAETIHLVEIDHGTSSTPARPWVWPALLETRRALRRPTGAESAR